MDRGAWWATVCGVTELDTNEGLILIYSFKDGSFSSKFMPDSQIYKLANKTKNPCPCCMQNPGV